MTINTINDLKPDPNNANRGTERGHRIVNNSIQRHGAGRSGLAARDGTMIAGSQTLEEMAALGMKIKLVHTTGDEWVVVIRDDVEPGSEQATLMGLEDNRGAQEGIEWDPGILAELAQQFDVSGLFTGDELAEWAQPSEPDAGDEDAPVSIDETKPTRCQPGDVWRIGRHTVACVDSTDRAVVERLIAGRKVGMVWSDAPYGIDIVAADVSVGGGEKYDYPFGGVKKNPGASAAKRIGTIGGDKPFGSARPVVGTDGADNIVRAGRYAPVVGDESTETARTSATLLLEIYPKALHIWWGANHFSDAFPPSPCWIVWDKENTGNFADAELAWCSDDSAVRIFRHMWNGMLRASEHGKRIHPTQKPIALCAWAFGKYGAVGDLIFDPFLGSGPSLKAAEVSGRTVVGCELAPAYVDHIIEWGEAHGLPVELVPSS